MDWIFSIPREWKIALIQGIVDGDGFASIPASRAGIGSKMNTIFLIWLLKSVDIESRAYQTGIEISKTEAIRNASELPLFKNATEKQAKLDELVKMLNSMERKPISGAEAKEIRQLSEEGFSDGEVTEYLWKQFGIARRPTTIRSYLKRIGLRGQ